MKIVKILSNNISIDQNKTILDAMTLLNDSAKRKESHLLLVIDDVGKLVGTVTDGDIRRAFLKGFTSESPIKEACKMNPIVIPEGLSEENIQNLMQINEVNSIPVVDKDGVALRVECLDEYGAVSEAGHVAIIMAGGEGVRLKPLTDDIPKPMLKVAGVPILQIILESLKSVGFKRFILNVRYLSHVIEDYFGDGSKQGVDIKYIYEPKPLGTAGSLGIIPDELKPDKAFLVLNGDLLTTLDFKVFVDFHISTKYDFTLCGRPYEVEIPFGYPVISGDIVEGFREKPTFTHLVNSGIYCVSPELINEVPKNVYFDMPDLIRNIISKGKRVGVFPLREQFHEIGRHESYAEAEVFCRNNFPYLY
jgi:dTDP-glucose pyrophosphorylase